MSQMNADSTKYLLGACGIWGKIGRNDLGQIESPFLYSRNSSGPANIVNKSFL